MIFALFIDPRFWFGMSAYHMLMAVLFFGSTLQIIVGVVALALSWSAHAYVHRIAMRVLQKHKDSIKEELNRSGRGSDR